MGSTRDSQMAAASALAVFAFFVVWSVLQPPRDCNSLWHGWQPLALLIVVVPVGALAGRFVPQGLAPVLAVVSIGGAVLLGIMVYRGARATAEYCAPPDVPPATLDGGTPSPVPPPLPKVEEKTPAPNPFERAEQAADAGTQVAATKKAKDDAQAASNQFGGIASRYLPKPTIDAGVTDAGGSLDGGPTTTQPDGGPALPRPTPPTGPEGSTIDPAVTALLAAACLAASEGNAALCGALGALLNLGFGSDEDVWKTISSAFNGAGGGKAGVDAARKVAEGLADQACAGTPDPSACNKAMRELAASASAPGFWGAIFNAGRSPAQQLEAVAARCGDSTSTPPAPAFCCYYNAVKAKGIKCEAGDFDSQVGVVMKASCTNFDLAKDGPLVIALARKLCPYR